MGHLICGLSHDTHMKFTNLSTLLNPKPPPTPKFDTHTHNRASYPSSMDKISHGFRLGWINFGRKSKRTWNGFRLEPLESPFSLHRHEISSSLKMARSEKRFLQIERVSMREKDRKRAYRLMREAKRREVWVYWVLFRREVESFFFFFKKVGSWNLKG